MTDKEQLELAAKAARLEINWQKCAAHADDYEYLGVMGPFIGNVGWNPLTDDGDALRLAVKLRIEPHFVSNEFVRGVVLQGSDLGEWEQTLSEEQLGSDQYAATRRAIVRAAAEIGKWLVNVRSSAESDLPIDNYYETHPEADWV